MNKKKKKKTAKQRKGSKKSSKGSSTKKSWKKFEELVSRIEATLAPHGAIVTSPDHLIDMRSGQSREVDACIRYKIDTTEIIITVECRERAKIQDSMWIEQLVTKQKDLGVSKTIAVSIKGFTEPAIKKANYYGIELRKVKNIEDDIINKWLVTRTQIGWKVVDWSISIDEAKEKGDKIAQAIKNEYVDKGNRAFLYSQKLERSFSVRDLFSGYLEMARDKTGEIAFEKDGFSGTYKLEAKILKGQISVKTSVGISDLVGLKVDYRFYKYEVSDVKASAGFTYSDTTTDLVKGIEFEIETNKGTKELFTIHQKLLEGTTVARVRKFKL